MITLIPHEQRHPVDLLHPQHPVDLLHPQEQQQRPVRVRRVWASNVDLEFSIIAQVLPRFPMVSFDTEFPRCTVLPQKPHYLLSADERYAFLKANVEQSKLTQLGLTLFDADGNLPGVGEAFIWEFNFCDFDVRRDLFDYNSDGIDFRMLFLKGIDPCRFAECCHRAGLLRHCPCCPTAAEWIAFSSEYDFGYLVKASSLDQRLPETLQEFLLQVAYLFGNFLDVKNLMRHCDGLFGGLEKVARTMGITREVGYPHEAGSDSLLTARVFLEMKKLCFDDEETDMARYRNAIWGFRV
ncbi:putative CCR4-associated factor 1 homolog 9 [Curcuma longa]|uniref:putative CCR4-associated factor 1 homolog 9 n=1 Tax=Curcuma longa TaxID=136217 RepID=UPI003D9DCA7C